MKKILWTLFVIFLLGVWVLLLIKNPQSAISQKVLPLIGLENILTWQTTTLANPASVYCEQNSGTLEIVTDLSGWQLWVCHLSGGVICDERAYFRGECPKIQSYTKDENNVYFKGQEITGADPITFQIIDDRHAKDKNHVYYALQIIQLADPITFQLLNSWFSYRDKNHMWVWWEIVTGADPNTFQEMNDFSKDKDHVFLWTYMLIWADPSTFENLGNGIYRDKNHIYNWYSKIMVKEADSATFQILNDYYSKDKDHVFLFFSDCVWNEGICSDANLTQNLYKVMKWIDPNTFQILENKRYVKDKNNVYYDFQVLKWTDTTTFEVITGSTSLDAQDKYHKYQWWKIVQ